VRRILVSTVVPAAALVFAGSALATYTPRLVVTQAATATSIHLTIPKADDATLKLTIYTPPGAAATLNQAPGTQIGTVTAQVNAKAISPDAILPLTGTVVVANPTDATIMAAATACTQSTTHAATWALVLSAAGQTLQVPAWIDPTVAPETAFGADKITVCLPSPDIPQSAGGAAFGAKLLDVNFTVNGVFGPSTAPITAWPGVFTPYLTGTATPNPAGTVTALGIAAIPSFSFTAKTHANRRVTVAGRVSAAGVPAPNELITVYDGTRRIAGTKTSATGTFALTTRLARKGVHSLRAKLTAADTDVTAQGCALVPAGAPTCVSATAAGGTRFSKAVRVRIK